MRISLPIRKRTRYMTKLHINIWFSMRPNYIVPILMLSEEQGVLKKKKKKKGQSVREMLITKKVWRSMIHASHKVYRRSPAPSTVSSEGSQAFSRMTEKSHELPRVQVRGFIPPRLTPPLHKEAAAAFAAAPPLLESCSVHTFKGHGFVGNSITQNAQRITIWRQFRERQTLPLEEKATGWVPIPSYI